MSRALPFGQKNTPPALGLTRLHQLEMSWSDHQKPIVSYRPFPKRSHPMATLGAPFMTVCSHVSKGWRRQRCRLQSPACRWISASPGPSALPWLASPGPAPPACTCGKGTVQPGRVVSMRKVGLHSLLPARCNVVTYQDILPSALKAGRRNSNHGICTKQPLPVQWQFLNKYVKQFDRHHLIKSHWPF